MFKNEFDSPPLFYLIPFLIFVLMAVYVFFTDTNTEIFYFLNEFSQKLPSFFWKIFTEFGDVSFAIALFSFFLTKNRHQFLLILVSGLLLGLFIQILKFSFAVPRPPLTLPEGSFLLIGEKLNYKSFPSGHSATFFFVFFFFCAAAKKEIVKVLFFLLASLGAFSRIAIGVHFPLDILIGGTIGWMWGWSTLKILCGRFPHFETGSKLFYFGLFIMSACAVDLILDTNESMAAYLITTVLPLSIMAFFLVLSIRQMRKNQTRIKR